ncbi:class I SAM-dependent methyltransferase [Mucilaginibacter puniceus]
MSYNELYQDKNQSYYVNERKELLEFVPPHITSALDIGCGAGNFGRILKTRFNAEVWGIEPDKKSAAIAEGVLDKIINDVFDDESLKKLDRKFDVIFFNDVLEHVPDPDWALRKCHQLLNPGGVIVASLPNMRFYTVINELLFEQDFKYQDSGIMDKTHLRFFTKKSMIRLFNENGYTIKSIEGINQYPVQGKKMKFLSWFLKKWLTDITFLQYAIVAYPDSYNA